MVEKTCIKCGFTGDEELFVKKENVCKKCNNKRKRQYYKNNKEKESKRKKKYYEENKEKILKRDQEYRKNNKDKKQKYDDTNKEKIARNKKQYYKNNKEKFAKRNKENYENNKEERLKYNKKYYKNNKEKISKQVKEYQQTPKGKIIIHKRRAKRRNLGHEPINTWFKSSEAHHLRYSKTIEEQDNSITLYVPRKLHRSIYHNGNTGRGMKEINIACLEWYFKITPEEEQNPKAAKLYNNYLALPEPQWEGDE